MNNSDIIPPTRSLSYRVSLKQDVSFDHDDFNMNDDHSMARELLKVATCVIVENPEELLDRLPLDIQVTQRAYVNFYVHFYVYDARKLLCL